MSGAGEVWAVDSIHKIKFTQRLLALVQTSEQKNLARTLLCDDPSVVDLTPILPVQPPDSGLSGKEVGVIIVGLFPTLAGIVVDDRRDLFICLALSWVAAMCVCTIHQTKIKWKVIFYILATGLYFWIGYTSNNRFLTAEFNDVANHLDIDMLTPYLAGNKAQVPFIVRNGGSSKIAGYESTCIINKLMGMNNGSFVVPPGIITGWNNSPIEPGGDGQTNWCPLEMFNFPEGIRCLDVTVQVDFELSAQKGRIGTKKKRVVAARTWGEHWFQQSPTQTGNYCDGSAETEAVLVPKRP